VHVSDTRSSPDFTIRERVQQGVVRGARVALLVTILSALAYIFGGPEAIPDYGMTYPAMIAGMWIGCVGAGALAGAMVPFVTSSLRAALTGMIASLPFALAAVLMEKGPEWTIPLRGFTVVAFARLAGGPGGIVVYQQSKKARHRRRT
jgi:hypothetical protein